MNILPLFPSQDIEVSQSGEEIPGHNGRYASTKFIARDIKRNPIGSYSHSDKVF